MQFTMIQVIIELLTKFITCGCGCNISSLCWVIIESISFLSSSLSCSPTTSPAFYPSSWICHLFSSNILFLAMASFACCSSNNWTLLSSWIFFGGLQLNYGCFFCASISCVRVGYFTISMIMKFRWFRSYDVIVRRLKNKVLLLYKQQSINM
jgi:hypothetical protein